MVNWINPSVFAYSAHNFWIMARERIGCMCGENTLLVSDIPLYKPFEGPSERPWSGRGRRRFRNFRGLVEADVRCLRCGAHGDISVLETGIDVNITGRKAMILPEIEWVMEDKGCDHISDWLVSPMLAPMNMRSVMRYSEYLPDEPENCYRHLVVCGHHGCRKRAFVWLTRDETFPIWDRR